MSVEACAGCAIQDIYTGYAELAQLLADAEG